MNRNKKKFIIIPVDGEVIVEVDDLSLSDMKKILSSIEEAQPNSLPHIKLFSDNSYSIYSEDSDGEEYIVLTGVRGRIQ